MIAVVTKLTRRNNKIYRSENGEANGPACIKYALEDDEDNENNSNYNAFLLRDVLFLFFTLRVYIANFSTQGIGVTVPVNFENDVFRGIKRAAAAFSLYTVKKKKKK